MTKDVLSRQVSDVLLDEANYIHLTLFLLERRVTVMGVNYNAFVITVGLA